MPYLKLRDSQYPLAAGETTLGAFDGAGIRLPSGDPSDGAIVSFGASGVSIRLSAAGAVVMVNGVQLGMQPSPLLHGDKVEIGGHELRLGEDQKGGNTSFVSAAEVAKMVGAKSGAAPKKPTTATGGRLVSLVDGREYPVQDAGLSFGREVGNDVVIASTEISRRHASIAPAANGYVITDHSTNGVWVNGARVAGEQLLGRGDVIKMGAEEFRFYADVAKVTSAAVAAPDAAPVAVSSAAPLMTPSEPPAAPVAAAPVAAPVAAAPAAAPVAAPLAAPAAARAAVAAPAPVEPVVPAPVVAPSLAYTMMGAPAAKRPTPLPAAEPPAALSTARAALATLEIVAEGPLKGLKFELHSALTNIGRGEHNDIAIKDESISDSHAKIQKRGDGWYVVDQESTNGTYVGGRRVQGEVRVEGAPDLRFGGIKMTFRPAAVSLAEGGGTRAIAAVNVDALRKQAAARPATKSGAGAKAPGRASALVQEPAADEKKKGCAAVIVLLVSVAGTGVGLLSLLLFAGR